MKRGKINAVEALERAEARMRRASALPPRLVRREQAAQYVSAPFLFEEMEKAGWIKPTVTKHRMTLFDLNDIDACIERLKTGQYPDPQAAPTAQPVAAN